MKTAHHCIDFAKKRVKNVLPLQTRGVVLLTYYRSGSSLVGELFNQHPDVFYHFEPLFPYSGDCSDQPAYKKEKVNLIGNILECYMPNWRVLFQKMAPKEMISNDRQCLHTGACFRQNSKDLCYSGMCPRGITTVRPPIRKELQCIQCGPLNLDLIDNLCRLRKVTAIKTIRICDLTWLDELLHSDTFDLKVVHLIRDPRAIARSRRSIPGKVPT